MSAESSTTSVPYQIDLLGFSELMKPELTGLSVLTVICAYYLASPGPIDLWKLFFTALGTLLIGGAAGTLNQYIERDLDGLMKRTERRPLPAGRLTPVAALAFGILLSFSGCFLFLLKTNPLTFIVSFATLSSYLFIYTPLKRITSLNTVIGAIPGALPVLIGWTAVRNEISLASLVLFGILYVWQIPHFLSLGWMYRKDYSRAGFKMLPVIDHHGRRTGNYILFFTIVLIPLTMALAILGVTGYYYLVAAVILGALFLLPVLRFAVATRGKGEDAYIVMNSFSRRIFFASLAYLPVLMLLMTLDKS